MEPTKGEKGVYRRNLGIFLLIIGGIIATISGFNFYSPDSNVIWAVLAIGATLLGVGNVTDIWKTKK